MRRIAKRPVEYTAYRCTQAATLLLPCPLLREKMQVADNSFAFGPWKGLYSAHFGDVAERWPRDPGKALLSPAYLAAQEESLPGSLRPRFLVLEDAQGPFAWMLLQVAEFRALEDIREYAVWSGALGGLRRLAGRVANFKLLICGNLFVPGRHGWMVRSGGEAALLQHLPGLLRCLARREGASVILCKDFEAPLPGLKGMHALDFQPNMVLELDPAWRSFDDYLEAMHSKYRIRARRAFKKGEAIHYQPLSLAQTELLAPELTAMYRQVVRASGFSLSEAGPEYLPGLQRHLGPDLSITACYKGAELCGFYSTLRNGDDLEAHFVGFDPEVNRQSQLYLNMLYRMVEEGIQKGLSRVVFARTALEIKSSVGAVPQPAMVYMAHVNPLLNLLLPFAVRFLEPREEWVQRHPFKE